MSVDRDFVLSALLQHNFFPTQKKAKEEMPPIFTSVAFTPDVAKKLIAGKPRKVEGYQGYDAVEYKLTRFNGVPAAVLFPIPPHTLTCRCAFMSIGTSWITSPRIRLAGYDHLNTAMVG